MINNFVVWLFWAMVVLGFFHFLWEGLIAPVLRLRIRFQLFAIRDQFRSMAGNEDAVQLEICEKITNSAIYIVHNFGLIDYLFMQMAFRDAKAETSHPEPLSTEHAAKISEVQRYVEAAVVVNSFGLFIYMFPVLYCLVQLKNFKKMVFRPIEELEHYFPKSQYGTS